MALAGVMFVIGAAYFTATTTAPPVIDWIGTISFCGWLPTGIVGLVLLIVGLVQRTTNDSNRV